jgi:hypothetical protein
MRPAVRFRERGPIILQFHGNLTGVHVKDLAPGIQSSADRSIQYDGQLAGVRHEAKGTPAHDQGSGGPPQAIEHAM